jgi:flagellar hook-associated protein 3 FlgL
MSQILNNIYTSASLALRLHTEAIARLQEQAATGARINRASDGPSEAYRILEFNSQERALENYIDNLSDAVSILELSSSVVGDMMSELTEAKTRLTQIASGVYTEEQRKATAEGINDILEHMVLLANTKQMNQYIFGGSDTDSAPYVVERTNGEITSVTYQGSLETRNVEMAPGVQSSAFYVGDNIFCSDSRSAPIFLGDTGAEAGTGTSSVTGDVWLNVTYNDVSGHYELYIDDEDNPVDVDPSEDITNLAVTNLAGEVLYVNAEGIAGTGVELVRIPGTYDVFNTLITIRDILENDRELSEAQLQELRNKSHVSLEEVHDLLSRQSVSVGSRIGFLDSLKYSLKNLKYDAEDESTRLQEADIAQVAIDLSRRELLYQMSLSVAARIMSISLLDFLG